MEEIIFPNQIRMYRRLRGRSMQELADHLGVSLSAISKIEKGYRRIDQEQLVRVAELLVRQRAEFSGRRHSVMAPGTGKKKQNQRKGRLENTGCRFAPNPQRKEPDTDRSSGKFGHDAVRLSPD